MLYLYNYIVQICAALCFSSRDALYFVQLLLSVDRLIAILNTWRCPANSSVLMPWQRRLFTVLEKINAAILTILNANM